MTHRKILLASTGLALAMAIPAQAQGAGSSADSAGRASATPTSGATAAIPAESEEYDNEDIVVTGFRPRGSVTGDIPPENTLTTRDIRATGATSITELLAAIAPQTGSARGSGGPVLLLNGTRISGFQEVRDLPPEAIERVEILPEEVALKYGYSADQRVVNIVLRPRFRSTAARADAGGATDGGTFNGLADVSRLMINKKGRINLTLHAERNGAIKESERDIVLQPLPTQPQAIDPRPYRTLTGSQRSVRATANINRTILGGASATLTAEVAHSDGQSLFGVPTGSLSIPSTSPFAAEGSSVLLGFPALGSLIRNTDSNTGHLGLSVNGTKQRWRYSMTGTADIAQNITRSDRGPNLASYQSRLDANDPTLDPLAALSATDIFARDRSRSTQKSAGLDATLNGPLATLPAGRANVTLKVGVDTLRLDSFATRAGLSRSANLGRDHLTGSVNLDLPIAKRNGPLSAIGSLTLNANVELEHFSDFGTLTTIGAGANWSPAPRLNFITSWNREEGAPSINHLGDPILVTPGVRVFDYTRGATVLVLATTGGNSALLAGRRDVLKIGANWQPLEKTDLKFRADFVTSRLKNPVETFPGPSAPLEAAFRSRFTRNPPCPVGVTDCPTPGLLTAVDFRPVNYDSARSDVLRIGVDFTKPLKSAAPSQALIDQFRKLRAQKGGGDGGPPPGSGPGGDRGGGGERGGGGFGGRGGGGPFGGSQRGRLQFSLTDTIALVDKAVIRPGIAALDYLNGSANSGGFGGGGSRHTVEAQAGYYNNGLGARFSANYRSGTDVLGGQNGTLRFSPLSTFDLRFFANLGDDLSLLAKHPWLRGASIRIEVSNIFDEKQNVRDLFGMVPLGYQPDLIDPLGRTISISFRKLFIPRRFFQRQRAPQSQPTG